MTQHGIRGHASTKEGSFLWRNARGAGYLSQIENYREHRHPVPEGSFRLEQASTPQVHSARVTALCLTYARLLYFVYAARKGRICPYVGIGRREIVANIPSFLATRHFLGIPLLPQDSRGGKTRGSVSIVPGGEISLAFGSR